MNATQKITFQFYLSEYSLILISGNGNALLCLFGHVALPSEQIKLSVAQL